LPRKKRKAAPQLVEAETRLQIILAKDNAVGPVDHAAKRLLNLVRLRLRPEETLHDLGRAITKKDSTADFKQAVWDYTALFDKFVSDEDTTTRPFGSGQPESR